MTDAADTDVLIVGAGIAGASLAYFAAARRRVVLLEAESQPGWHSTGRSAAMFIESYGPPAVRALTRASRAFFEAPPAGFSATPLLRPRGTLSVAAPGQEAALEAAAAELGLPRWNAGAVLARVPALRPERVVAGLWDEGAADLDVHALHQGFLRGARARGATLVTDARIDAIERTGTRWSVRAGPRRWQASQLVDAAGAWADELAALAGLPPVGLQPRRRSAFTFAPPAGLAVADWPCVVDIDEQWYFKPDAGVLLASPANADATVPQDVQPEELDIATAIARLEAATLFTIRRPIRSWAGLRSFVADGEPVVGEDPRAPGFFWLAAQGGYGIQTAPALGAFAAARLDGEPVPLSCREAGLDSSLIDITRLREHP
ncbi:MAG: FAD-binding oxidoreductase [Piscinibacter sp.]|nr:FAD-binding oxidoreductase [Piscinibacter sp.]